eukprot:3758183-Prymnesium_polylepis.1
MLVRLQVPPDYAIKSWSARLPDITEVTKQVTKMSLKEIRVELFQLKVATRGMLEKADLVSALVKVRMNGVTPEPDTPAERQYFVR